MNYESLFILFKADTSDLKKGNKEAEQSTNKLKDSLKETNTFADTLEKSFGRLAASVSAVVAAGLSASALFNGLKEATDFSTQLAYQADQLGVNVENLNAWDKAIEHVGGTAADVSASIEGLHEKFGVSKEQALDIVLPSLADPLSKMTANNAQIYGKSYGLTPAMITLLREGNIQLAALLLKQKELYGLTEADAEIFKGLNDEVLNTKNSIQHMFIEMAIAAAPAFEALLKGIQATFGWLVEHADFIKGVLIGIAALGTAIALSFSPVAAEFLLINAPIIAMGVAIGGVIAACGFLYDQFQKLEIGQDNWITKGIDKWNELKDSISNAFAPLKDMIDGVKTLFGWIDNLAKKSFEYSGANIIANLTGGNNNQNGLNPINSMTSSAISNSTRNSSTYSPVTNITGNTVVTQSTDPHAAFRDLQDKYSAAQYSKTANGFADGNSI